MSGFALRFAVEVAFLVLLALAVGLAELATPWIVAVMVIGWVLVAVIEWLAWQSEQEPGDEEAAASSRSRARRGHVVGPRRDPRAAARGRQVSPALVQRLLALAAAALLTGSFGVALSQAGRDSSRSALPEPAVGPWGGWTTVLAGVAPQAPRAGRKSGCDWVVVPRTQGVIHPTLPCGSSLYVEYGGLRALTRVVARLPVGQGRQLDLTPAARKAAGPRGRARGSLGLHALG